MKRANFIILTVWMVVVMSVGAYSTALAADAPIDFTTMPIGEWVLSAMDTSGTHPQIHTGWNNAARDPVNKKFLLFGIDSAANGDSFRGTYAGGCSIGYTNDVWVYNETTRIWVLDHPSNYWDGPECDGANTALWGYPAYPLPGHPAAGFFFHSGTNAIIINGLPNRLRLHHAMWSLNLSASPGTYTLLQADDPAVGATCPEGAWPRTLMESAMTYDPVKNWGIMGPGGLRESTCGSSGSVQGQTWVYDFTANTWSQKTPSPNIAGSRYFYGFAYDSFNAVHCLFGSHGDWSLAKNETWCYNSATGTDGAWTQKGQGEPKPAKRGFVNWAYDSTNHIFLLHGGRLCFDSVSVGYCTGVNGGETGAQVVYTDTWAYNYSTDTWTQLFPATTPTNIRLGDLMEYDETNNVFRLYSDSGFWYFRYAAAPPPADTAPPAVAMTDPVSATPPTIVAGTTVALAASASDNVAVANVQFQVDGSNIGSPDTQAPYTATWNSTTIADGQHTVRACATDTASPGNTACSIGVVMDVQNDAPPGGACGSVTNATTVYLESTAARPAFNVPYTDPILGGCLKRITDTVTLGNTTVTCIYSELQCYNRDQTKILVRTGHIISSSTYAVLQSVPFNDAMRWDPANANVLWSTSGASLQKYDLTNPGAGWVTVRTFAGYSSLNKDASWQEMSDDGRYLALVGKRTADAVNEIFVYDIQTDTKGPVLVGTTNYPAWAGITPSGRYIIVNWYPGGDAGAQTGVRAHDRDMNFVGIVATGHGHGDIAVAPDGSEWYVDFSPDNYVGVTGPVIKKNRIPSGYTDWQAGDVTGIQVLFAVDWSSNMHVSCRAPRVGWCAVSLYSGGANGVQVLETEVVKLYLDSTQTIPHLERMAQVRTDVTWVGANCSAGLNYWAQPHGTVSRGGEKVLFGSSWGQVCRAETYEIDAIGSGSPPPPPPPPVTAEPFRSRAIRGGVTHGGFD